MKGVVSLVGHSLLVIWTTATALAAPAVAAGPLLPSPPRPLVEVLEEVSRHYGVFFTYDAEIIGQQEVEFELRPDETLPTAIARLLSNTGLQFDFYGDKYLVVYRHTKRGERTAGKLRRKIQQLQRLEQGGDLRLQRSGRPAQEQLTDLQQSIYGLNTHPTAAGVVSDESGAPLIGVSIQLLGSPLGTVTDQLGRFQLGLPADTAALRFSYIGYQSRVLRVSARQPLQIQLAPGNTALPEVLVVGYGTVHSQRATASVQQIENDDYGRQASTAPDQLLLGRIAGVQVAASSGEPGAFQSVRIRGSSSMNASNEPLYVIDGMPVDNLPHIPGGLTPGRNPLNAINPSDIARISVLKDAAACAIYGSRAANGIILIETKKSGRQKTGELRYEAWSSLSRPGRPLEVFDAADYRELVKRIAPHRQAELGAQQTDWQSAIFRPASGQQHSLSYRKGTAHSGYRLSVGYLDQASITAGARTRRANASLYLQQGLWRQQLHVQGHLKLAQLYDRFLSPDILEHAYLFDPTQPIYASDNRWGGYFEYEQDLAIKNPLAIAKLTQDESRQFRALGTLQTTYSPSGVPGLQARLNLGYDRTDGLRNFFAPAALRSQYVSQGEYRAARQERTNLLWESYLDYRRQLVDIQSNLQLIGGYSFQWFQGHYPEQRLWEIQSSRYKFNHTPISGRQSASEQFSENKLASFFGRGNYDWRERYYLTASLRVDGSSRFSPSRRWATFPAVAAAWRISEEPFLHGRWPILTDLKVRAGWGLTGNQEIGDYQYLPTYTYGDKQVRYPFGDEYIVTARPNAISTHLKWEQTSSLNLALEATFWRGRLSTTLEWYRAKTQDLLSRVIVPAGTNLSDIVLINSGSLINRGWELSLQTQPIRQGKWQWDMALNLASNRNRISSLGPTPELNFQAISTGAINGGTGNTIQVNAVGYPLNAFYVFQHKRDANGRPLADNVDHNADGRIDLADIYEDRNGDGQVNDGDKQPWQQAAPRLLAGLQSRLSRGRWGLQASLRLQTGNYVYNNIAALGGYYDRLLTEPALLNAPRSIHQYGFHRAQYFSDVYVENAAFLRLDALAVDYRLPRRGKRPALRLYSTLQNVFTLTSYTGLDPEVGNVSGNPLVPRFGIDDNVFPRAQTLVAGLELEL